MHEMGIATEIVEIAKGAIPSDAPEARVARLTFKSEN